MRRRGGACGAYRTAVGTYIRYAVPPEHLVRRDATGAERPASCSGDDPYVGPRSSTRRSALDACCRPRTHGHTRRVPVLWTIGHSTHPLESFLDLLEGHGIRALVDVRTVPRSRRHPQFGADALARSLPQHGIDYQHVPGLGGWRHARPDSPNSAWRNESFRGYADYALTAEFADALGHLCRRAARQPTAIMCSEALWWRCHRRLIADPLVAAGWEVCHIGPDGRLGVHALADFAALRDDGTLAYPSA
jgi:hypothetical protein